MGNSLCFSVLWENLPKIGIKFAGGPRVFFVKRILTTLVSLMVIDILTFYLFLCQFCNCFPENLFCLNFKIYWLKLIYTIYIHMCISISIYRLIYLSTYLSICMSQHLQWWMLYLSWHWLFVPSNFVLYHLHQRFVNFIRLFKTPTCAFIHPLYFLLVF